MQESILVHTWTDKAFAVVSDLAGMGRFSPENDGGKWLGGASAAALGARFRGRNSNGGYRWSTIATVTAYDAPRLFSFDVTYGTIPVSTWVYDITSSAEGVTITERWTDNRPGWFALLTSPLRRNRQAFTARSMRATLEAMKAELEASR